MMMISQKLREAKALIQKGWCRGKFAKTKNNKQTHFSQADAEKFCAVGACYRAGLLPYALRETLVKALGPGADLRSVVLFNDRKRNKRDVLRLFDKAIALAEKDGV